MALNERADLKPSPSARLRTTQDECSQSTGLTCPAIKTSTRPSLSAAWRTWLRQAFPARTYHSLEQVPDFPAHVQVFGGRYAEPFAWYDHGTRCWRTWQRCLIEDWARYSEAWPRSGMTRNGIAYRLPPLVPRMSGTECGSLLPTLTATGNLLSPAMQKWPRHRRLATLTKRDGRTLKGGQDRPNRTGGPSLLQQMLDQGYESGRLNPRWCEWFMGYPQKWTLLKRLETQSSRKSPSSSAARSSKQKA
mgnify:CR=1 FL=1